MLSGNWGADCTAPHSPTGNWGLSRTVTGLSGCVRTTWNVSCCESRTSYTNDLNFKRNIMYLICISLLKTKPTMFCQCQRVKKLNLHRTICTVEFPNHKV